MIQKLDIYIYSIAIVLMCACSSTNKASENKFFKNKKNTLSQGDKVKGERLFFNGQKEKVKENYFEALDYFEEAVNVYPKIDAAWFEVAKINYQQKDYKSALDNIKKALEITPKNKWYREFYGEMLSANTLYEQAATVFESLQKDYPNNIDYYYDEAYFLLKQGKNKEAIKVYNNLESIIGITSDVSIQKYKLFLRDGDTKEAENELIKLCEAFPKNLKHLNKLAKFQLVNEDKDKAEKTLQKILVQDPENTNAMLTLADLYREKGNDAKYKEYSKKAFTNEKIDIDTKIAVLYNYINRFQNRETNNLDDAFEYMKLMAKSHPEDAKTWALYGDLYNLVKEPVKALENYKKSLQFEQDVFTVWQQMFFIESDLKNYKDLIVDTKKAKELFPNQALIYFFNGLANHQEKNNQEAIVSYKQGIKLASKQTLLLGQFYSNLAEAYHDIGDHKESDLSFDKALEINPNNKYVLNNYSYYLSVRGESLEKAKRMSEKSLDLSPDNPTYLDTYAWILYKNGEYKKALEIQKRAIDLIENPSAEMYDHLGDMWFKNNKANEALKNWKKAKEMGKESDLLNQKILNKSL